MKLNWGHKLAISMIGFIGFVVFLGIKMWSNNDSIEEQDYYAKGQKYEEQIIKERNTESLRTLPLIDWNKNSGLSITMPDSLIVTEATMLLYKPDASDKDKIIDVSELKISRSVVSEVRLDKGKWIAKFDWSSDGKEYYMEKIIFVE